MDETWHCISAANFSKFGSYKLKAILKLDSKCISVICDRCSHKYVESKKALKRATIVQIFGYLSLLISFQKLLSETIDFRFISHLIFSISSSHSAIFLVLGKKKVSEQDF